MENKRNYYSIVPADIRYHKKLSGHAKLMYAEFTALSNEKGYCWATNKYFAELYGKSEKTISRWINELIEIGVVKTDVKTFRYNDGTVKKVRYIHIDNSSQIRPYNFGNNRTDTSVPNHTDKNVPYNNTLSNNKEINISISEEIDLDELNKEYDF